MYSAIAANKRNTALIMAVFIGLVGAVGWAVSTMFYKGSYAITIGVVIVAAVYAFFQYFFAAKLATAVTGAQQIEKRDNPRLYRIVENLAIADGMPMPKVYIIDDPAPNAFATGRDPRHAIVAATTGLLAIMDDRELEGVMAHELGHVKNYDIRVSMIAFGLVSAIALITDVARNMLLFSGLSSSDDRDSSPNPVALVVGIVIVVLAPIVAMMIQMAISRQREYLADATGAMTTRYPEGLASALEKLARYSQPMRNQSTATAHLFFANPLKPGTIANLFSTHPPLEDRIKRLRQNEGKF